MKPSTIRNRTIHHPTKNLRSKMMAGHLSAELRKQYNFRSIRIVPGDTVRITRGVYKNVTGKVESVSPGRGVVVAGTKQEKLAGERYDIYIHPSNILITDLNRSDKRRDKKIHDLGNGNSDNKNNREDAKEQ